MVHVHTRRRRWEKSNARSMQMTISPSCYRAQTKNVLPRRWSNFSKYSAANEWIFLGWLRSTSVDKPTSNDWKPAGTRNFVLENGMTMLIDCGGLNLEKKRINQRHRRAARICLEKVNITPTSTILTLTKERKKKQNHTEGEGEGERNRQRRRSEAEQTETMVDGDKQEENDNTNGLMKKSNGEKEKNRGRIFWQRQSSCSDGMSKNREKSNTSSSTVTSAAVAFGDLSLFSFPSHLISSH